MHILRKLKARRGNTYLEYLIAAGAMAAAVAWFWDGGNYHGLAGSLSNNLQAAVDVIGGPLSGN